MSHNASAWSVRIPGVSRNLSQDEVNVLKEKGMSIFKKVASISVDVAAITVGLTVMGGEIALRKTAYGLDVASVFVAGTHDKYCKKVVSKQYLSESLAKAAAQLVKE